MPSRRECKYKIPYDALPRLRQMLAPYVEADHHARQHGRQYTVRSIYFDTTFLDFYREKKAGIKTRKKIRIRGYDTPTPDSYVFLEIKRRSDSSIAKNRAPVLYADLPALMRTGDVERYVQQVRRYPHALDDARRFLFHVYRQSLQPFVNVVYDREPYVGRLEPSVRVTMDKNLRTALCPTLAELYDERQLVTAMPRHFILEIKYYGPLMPPWARQIVQAFNLRQQALSKYVISLDAHGREALSWRTRLRVQRLGTPAQTMPVAPPPTETALPGLTPHV